ncbi:hypothetical protein OOU_Y34scaffold00267g12 [Pyricularia oryzae Y34]|uniref:Sm domain-containing protein n=2 Tax=Pyricularia oryzae TaxID=318829 RepID=A0AA97P414_PYRO3|nr:hypothetical protein OOU_Y34scaffold00267g12 [Pyricularia oryzae Y34]
MDEQEAIDFLSSLLNKYLRVTTTDTRMFYGVFKCTDPDRNLILAHAHEYRHPTPEQVAAHAKKVAAAKDAGEADADDDKMTLGMTSRYLGLIVVPGEHIVKIEVEEFASQLRAAARKGQSLWSEGGISGRH